MTMTSMQRVLAERLERLQLAVRSELASEISQLPGGVATFDAPGSYVNRIGAVALDGPVGRIQLEALEDFLVRRRAPPVFETSPASDPSAEAHLGSMGFTVGFTIVILVRELPAAPPLHGAPAGMRGLGPGLRVEHVERAELERLRSFVRITNAGFREPGEETPQAVLDVGLRGALHGNADSYVALAGEEIVGGGACETREGVTSLYGTAVLPGWRGQGLQQALFAARLARARELGSTLASVGSLEGSPTLRNALRFGFTEGYRRRCWTRPERAA